MEEGSSSRASWSSPIATSACTRAGRRRASPRVGGYLFAVALYEEFHVNKIATDLRLRHQGYGRVLIEDALARAQLGRDPPPITLEVRDLQCRGPRVLSSSYGFTEAYRRRAYYQDGEDALVLVLSLKAGP